MVVPLYTTHVEAIGRFLKIYGQTNHNEGIAIEAAIQDVVGTQGKLDPSNVCTETNIKVGAICLSKYTDGQYYRCKVIDHEAKDNVLVHFIDYGNDEIIRMKDMISLAALAGPNVEFLSNVAPQAKEYILAAYWNTNWTEQTLTNIRAAIVNEVVQAECFSSVRDYIFIKISLPEHGIADLATHLIERQFGQVCDLRSQRELLMLVIDGLETRDLNMGQVAYTSNTLNMHSKYDAICSYVQDGPFLFSVQPKKDLAELEDMMAELQTVKLREFPTDVLIGMACLVRGDRIYRGLITLMGPTSVVVCLVDYGHSRTVSYHHLYEMPAKYLKRKIFAIRSCISGYKKLDRYNKLLKERFRELVNNASNLTINVTPLEGTPSLHYCELFLDNGENVYDELQKVQTKFLELAENEPIPNGYEGEARITWIHSPARFYIRLQWKEEEYQKLAIRLNEFFESQETRPAMTEIRIGAICALKANKQWYRAEITDIIKTEDGQRKVVANFIDTGRDAEVVLTFLKRMNYDLCQVPPLALECSLYGVNIEERPKTVAQFARAINLQAYPDRMYLVKTFTRMTYKSYIIDLMVQSGDVLINGLLDDEGPLSLDKYYLKSATNGHAMSKEEDVDLTYVMPIGQTININLVSWISADEFYIHLKDQQKSFKEFITSLQKVPKIVVKETRRKGEVVLAKYSATDLFYRAEIFDHNDQLRKYKVLFSDIGARAIVSADQVFVNPFEFTKVPKFTHKCCLVDREKNPDAVKRIAAIFKEAEDVKCIVKERLKDDLNVVQVMIEGRDLLKVCKENGAGGRDGGSDRGEKQNQFVSNNEQESTAHKLAPELLHNQRLWIKPIDFLSKDVFRFSIKDISGELFKGSLASGAVHLGTYTAMDVLRIDNQIYHLKTIKEEDILPQPLLEESFSVTVSEPPSTVLNVLSVQMISSLAPVTRLLLEMKKHYDAVTETVPMDVLRQCQNQFFAVHSSGFWYRSQLMQVTDSEELIFDLVDYGRTEKIDQTKVQHLNVKFRALNRLATKVYLAIEQFTDKVGADVIVKEIGSLTRNISLILKVIENYRGCWIVDLVSNGFSISQVLTEKKLAIACAMAQLRKQIDRELEASQQKEDPVEIRQLEAIEIGHVDSPERIFVQLKSELPELKRMQETLQIIAPSLTAVGALKVGELCIAQNSFDGQWYRAKILDSAPDMTSVQFIDYGNTDVITSDKGAKLKKMVDGFSAIPEFAKFCSLPMRPGGGVSDRPRTEWDDDAFVVLGQYLEKPDKECEFLTETKLRRHFIRLFVQGEDIEHVLRSRGWGQSIHLIRSGSVCYVSHINSLAEFFIQLDTDGAVLDLLNQYFLNADSFLPASKPQTGAIYAAQYDDQQWYRAKLLKKGAVNDEWEVLFIDYGNTATVKTLREISSTEIRDITPLSRKCKLHIPKNVLTVLMEAESLFEEICQNGATLMVVNLVYLERDYSVVELVLKDAGNNLLELLPLNINPYDNDTEFDQ